jgi:hypothetical protein
MKQEGNDQGIEPKDAYFGQLIPNQASECVLEVEECWARGVQAAELARK